MQATRTMESVRSLHDDKRGAVMLMGLCMSCFLIGSLWFLIGVGDAIIFRDTMQEATDHATFTSAALHAKGMNFISACNLFMLAMVAVHILLGIVHDLALAGCIATFGFGCGAWPGARNAYISYAKVFKPAAAALHEAEIVAAYGYPLLGAWKGHTMGNDYGDFGHKKTNVGMLVVSPSLSSSVVSAPLAAVLKKVKKTPAPAGAKNSISFKKGLPVQAEKYSEVCRLIAAKSVNELFSIVGAPNTNLVATIVKGWIAGVVKLRYCYDMNVATAPLDLANKVLQGNQAIDKINAENAAKPVPAGGTAPKPLEKVAIDANSGNASCKKGNGGIDPGWDTWWACDGPLVPWHGTENGSPWNAVWGINIEPEYTDTQEHRVGIGGRRYGLGSSAEANTYFAQAEFYFDCSRHWLDLECNGSENAGFSVQWRARLKRLQFPQLGSLLSGFAASALPQLKAWKDFQNKLQKGKSQDPLTAAGIEGSINNVIEKYVTRPAQQGIKDGGGFLNPSSGAYH